MGFHPFHSIIAKRLFTRVGLLALPLILLTTAVVGWLTYRSELADFHRRFAEIESSYLEVIRSALWSGDQETLRLALIGICRLPGIQYAHIHSAGDVVCSAGETAADKDLQRIYPVFYDYNAKTLQLGELHVAGSRAFVYQKILKAVIATTLAQALAILTVFGLVLFLLYHAVIARLLNLTQYTSALSFDSLDKPLTLKPTHETPDELDCLAATIDRMRENLAKAIARQKAVETQLAQHGSDLEKLVAQRTSTLEETNEQLEQEIVERKTIEQEREKLISELRQALANIKKLSGMLPICANCKKIRDDQGYWNQVESYIRNHSEAEFSHSICPECAQKLYPDLDIYD